jgi:hypothetical protein
MSSNTELELGRRPRLFARNLVRGRSNVMRLWNSGEGERRVKERYSSAHALDYGHSRQPESLERAYGIYARGLGWS